MKRFSFTFVSDEFPAEHRILGWWIVCSPCLAPFILLFSSVLIFWYEVYPIFSFFSFTHYVPFHYSKNDTFSLQVLAVSVWGDTISFSGLTLLRAKSVGLFSLDLETFGHYAFKYFTYISFFKMLCHFVLVSVLGQKHRKACLGLSFHDAKIY